jgi:DNA repair exonuclease SbcCD ATPase subunit
MFTKSETNKTKTIDALIPMIDLFAVLAIVFMIYSSDEIIAEQEKSQETIDEIATEYKKLQQELAAAEEARERRRELLAENAVKSLEEIEAEREQKAKQLVEEFTQMMEQQQTQAKLEYEALVAKLELEQDKEVERQKAELEQETQLQIETKVAQLEQEKEVEVSSAKQVFEQQMTDKQEQLETTTQAIIASEMERVKDLSQHSSRCK